MASLPAELFARHGVSVIVKLPLSESAEIAIEQLYVIAGEHTFLPLFTSEASAREYARREFGDRASELAPVSFGSLRDLGKLLDAVALKGCQYVVFDPQPGGTPSFAVGDVADAIRDRLLRPSDN